LLGGISSRAITIIGIANNMLVPQTDWLDGAAQI
jgi:hypothetical protein